MLEGLTEAEADWKVWIAASKAASFGLKHSTGVTLRIPLSLAVVCADTWSSRSGWMRSAMVRLLSCVSEAGS